jgi:hypothetical protein
MRYEDEYILMCKQAVKAGLLYDSGEVSFWMIYEERLYCPTCDLFIYGDGDGDKPLAYCQYCGEKGEFREDRWLDKFKFSGHRCVPLFDQRQLQDMVVDEKWGCDKWDYLLDIFELWRETRAHSNHSLEQLWLAYVMKVKHSKEWTGKEWRERNG